MCTEAKNPTKLTTGSKITWGEAVETFRFDCQLRNLTEKTIRCYEERLTYFMHYLESKRQDLSDVRRKTIQNYVLSLKGAVSDETINGRIRVYRRFFNFLIEDDLRARYCLVRRLLEISEKTVAKSPKMSIFGKVSTP